MLSHKYDGMPINVDVPGNVKITCFHTCVMSFPFDILLHVYLK